MANQNQIETVKQALLPFLGQYDVVEKGEYDTVAPGENGEYRPLHNTFTIVFRYEPHHDVCVIAVYENKTIRFMSSGCAQTVPMLEAYGRALMVVRALDLKDQR